MVHALETAHRLLAPGGWLVEIHPDAYADAVEVHHGDRITFAATVPPFSEAEIRQAERAVAAAVQRGLFHIEQRATFDFRTYAATIAELRAFLEEAGAFHEGAGDEPLLRWAESVAPQLDERLRAAGAAGRIAYREQVHITRLGRR
jgi:hypothetical protein